jgi:WD40 repeat protein
MPKILYVLICFTLLASCAKSPAATSSITPTPAAQAEPLPSLQAITSANASEVTLLRTLEIPGYKSGSISQCNTAFSPDGILLLGVCGQNAIPVWEIKSGKMLYTLDPGGAQTVTCSFSPDGNTIACGGFDKNVTFWNAATGEKNKVFSSLPSAVWDISFSPDGNSLATCGIKDTVRLWDIASGSQIWAAQSVTTCLSLAFDPSGKVIAYGGRYGVAGVVDAATGAEIVRLLETGNPVGDISFSHDGMLLAAGRDDGMVYLWKPDDITSKDLYTQPGTLAGHSDYVNGVALNPDDSLLISSSHDGTTRIWDVNTLQSLRVLEGHQNAVLRGTFNPEGTLIATISWDGTIKLWGIPQ